MNDSSAANHKTYFISLTTMLSMSALQQLGKLMNPLTRKTEINLEAAQGTIDMLDMLEAKTRGNLDAAEAKLLKDTLAMLKMNYVETATDSERSAVSGQQSEGSQKTEASSQEPETKRKTEVKEQQAEAGAQKPADQKPEDKSPKFRKTYE